MLELNAVHKRFSAPQGEVQGLAATSLRVRCGELVVVVGPSGAGKTTLLLAAGALLAPTGGTVRIDGTDPYRMSGEQRNALRAGMVGFVFQQFHLVPYLTARENVMLPSLAAPCPDAADRAATLLREVNLAHRAEHLPAALSTGERQRVALARALFNRPKLLLADEPTGNLDDENGARVLRHLARSAEAGCAVLIATHDARLVPMACRTVTLEGADGGG